MKKSKEGRRRCVQVCIGGERERGLYIFVGFVYGREERHEWLCNVINGMIVNIISNGNKTIKTNLISKNVKIGASE